MDTYSDYDPFADVYDRHWGSFATRVVPVLDRLVLGQLDGGATILDLCCGTGQLAATLTERGYRVTGIDGSAAMIDIARPNAPRAQFLVADARSFTVHEQVDAVVSTFDSLNHLMTVADLGRVFHRVHASLKPAGVFVFDLNMEEGFRNRWRGSFGIATDDEVVVARSRFDPDAQLGQMDFTVMTPDGDRWRRTDLSLAERCYSESDVRSALEAAGFDQIEVTDGPDLEFGETGRSFFRCRRM
jgi:SAM-dependent methyltransferase